MFYFTINSCPFVTLRNLPEVMFSLHIIALLNSHTDLQNKMNRFFRIKSGALISGLTKQFANDPCKLVTVT
jgi:hypothetical protein